MSEQDELQDEYIELRLHCAGLHHVALLGRRSTEYGFQRSFNPFRVGRERLADGSKEEIHHLPSECMVYEIQRVEDGKLKQTYIATLKSDPNLHPISRRGAEVYASRIQPLREVIDEYPPMPDITAVHDEDDED